MLDLGDAIEVFGIGAHELQDLLEQVRVVQTFELFLGFALVGWKLRTPKRARIAFIWFTTRVRPPTRFSRSRFGRRASSSATVGIATMLQ